MRKKQICHPAPEPASRLAELQAIATTLSSSEDNREAAGHDIELEFPQPLEEGDSTSE
jgi:hypothetical protein